MLFHTGDLFLKVGYLLPTTQFKEGILMPALGSIFASKAGDKAGTGDRPGHMTSPAVQPLQNYNENAETTVILMQIF